MTLRVGHFGTCHIHRSKYSPKMILTHRQRMVWLVIKDATLTQLSIAAGLVQLYIE